MMRTDVIIAVLSAPRWDKAAQIAWRSTIARETQPPGGSKWFLWLLQTNDHVESRRECAELSEKLRNHEDLSLCWRMLAVDPQDPIGLSELLMTIRSALRGVDFEKHPELLPRLAVMHDVTRGKHAGEFGSLWHLASMHRDRRQATNAGRAERLPMTDPRYALQTLLQSRWADALGLLFAPTATFVGVARMQPLIGATLDATGARAATLEQIRALIETLYASGTPATGDLALAWLMLTADPREPASFLPIMPQLQFMLDSTELDERAESELRSRIRVWWRGLQGAFIDARASIFRIAADETNPLTEGDPEFEAAPDFGGLHRPHIPPRPALPVGPTLVVMPAKLATRLNNFQSGFKPIVDKAIPLVVALDVAGIRNTLHAEYPHATTAVDLLLRDLREGKPVALKPMLLVGSPGSGKSRLVRRLGELLKAYVHRFDAAASGDNHFAGTSKAWSNTEPSVPARAVAQSSTANPIVMIDEIDKAAERTNAGNLWSALTPFLERETASRYRDQSLDAQLDLSMVTYVAAANDDTRLPAPLRDRFRVVRVPSPTAAHLPALAIQVMKDLTANDEARAHDDPLATDELDVIGRAWARSGFSLRKLQKIVQATLEARDQHAPRH